MTTANSPKLAKSLVRTYDRPAGLDDPRSRYAPKNSNFEKWAWIGMRFSGVALVILVLGHVFIGLAWDNGVHRIDASYVAARWKQPLWQVWDLLMLWLAMLHGGNGVRVVIADYTRSDKTRFWLNTLLAVEMIFIIGIGTYVLLTFNPSSVAGH